MVRPPPSKASKLLKYMEVDSGMVAGLWGGEARPWYSENGASALQNGKVPMPGHTWCGHSVNHAFTVARFIFAELFEIYSIHM